MRRAVLDLQLGPEISEMVLKTLEPELNKENLQTRVDASVSGPNLVIAIEAEELSNLRAAVNSYIRWINCIYSINKVIENP